MLIALLFMSVLFSFSKTSSLKVTSRITLIVLFVHLFVSFAGYTEILLTIIAGGVSGIVKPTGGTSRLITKVSLAILFTSGMI